MVLQFLASSTYALVESSWMVSTVLVKYFLLTGVLFAVYKQEEYLENFKTFLDNFSAELVTSVVLLGFLALATGVNVEPAPVIISHLAAVTYFGYLFWEF